MTTTVASPRRTQEIAKLVGKLDSLPAAPRTYLEIADLVSKPGASLGDVARVLESDPALSVNVLHLVNSAFFGKMQQTTSIQHAVSRLGFEALKALVLSAHVFKTPNKALRGLSIEQFQSYSIQVARLTREFVSPAQRDEAFTTGLVHDVGKLVIALIAPDNFAKSLEASTKDDRAPFLLEREFVGICHAEAGAFLLAMWGIPEPVVSSVRYHHQPSDAPGEPSEVLAAVHAADALVGILTCGEPESRLDLAYLERARVLDRLPKWRKLVLAS